MWDDAKYWLRDLLAGVPVTATFEFGTDQSTVRSSNYKSYLD